jgi:hypothetical protein
MPQKHKEILARGYVDDWGKFDLDMGAYAPATRKSILKMLKNSEYKISMYILIFYMHTPSFMENQHFYVLCKKTKKKSRATPILAPNFILFYTQHKKCRFLVKHLCENIERWELRVQFFCRNFLKFWTLFKTDLKNREHMFPGAKTPP